VRIRARAEKHGIALRAVGGALAEKLHNLAFGVLPRDVEIALQAILGRNACEQVINRFRPDLAQHDFAIGLRLRKIAHGYL
jgi:hypothetical protein